MGTPRLAGRRDPGTATNARFGALETRYRGMRFRSRTEARWAVFFDNLGVHYDFEPQGFATPYGAYLPDFRLPEVSPYAERGGCWFEVKPREYPLAPPAEDYDRWASVALETNTPLVLARGMQDPRVWQTGKLDRSRALLTAFVPILDDPEEDDYSLWHSELAVWAVCERCGKVGIEWAGIGNRVCRHGRSPRSDTRVSAGVLHPRVVAAYEAALGARFEFGESG